MTPVVSRVSPVMKATRVTIRMQRLPEFYMVNVVLILSIVSLMSMLAFAMPFEDVGDRTSCVLTLMLTSVTFKFVLGTWLPRVPYHTYLDVYVIGEMILLVVNSFLAVVPYQTHRVFGDAALDPDVINLYCALVMAGSIVFLLVAWLLGAYLRCHGNFAVTVQILPNRNWYAFRFYGLAHFLQSAGGVGG